MTQATMARPQSPRRTFPPISVIALVIVGALLCAGMAYALRDPDFVSRVTVENPGSLAVNVSVRPADDDARLILATVPPTTSATNLDVLDQGDDWIFSFSSGGVDGGSIRVSRAKLADDGWRVVVPDSVIRRLASGTFVPAYDN
ncbi:MAG TPA: hypothetical protein VK549_07515 [Acidimicrobiia bacterium]|nr:hypothetical protein [Acidimicrobiia bacterium]